MKYLMTMVVVIVPATLSILLANASPTKPVSRRPPPLRMAESAAAAASSTTESLFKRVIQGSVAYVLFPLYVTLEIIWSSTGVHSDVGSLTEDGAADARTHEVCAAILHLWTDLRTLERAQRVYHAALERVVNAPVWRGADQTWPSLVARIDEAYAQDAVLGDRYVRFRDHEAAQQLRLRGDHRDVEMALSARDRDRLLAQNRLLAARMMLFKFHDELQNAGENGALARLVVAVANTQDVHRERLQKLFENALNDVGPAFGINGADTYAAELLFADLRKKIADDAALTSAFDRQKNAVRL